jgi:hypothetical protein
MEEGGAIILFCLGHHTRQSIGAFYLQIFYILMFSHPSLVQEPVILFIIVIIIYPIFYHHHQPFNVPTAGAQAFLMDYT